MRIVSLRAEVWTLPLRAPFAIAQRVAYEAQNVWICVETDSENFRGIGASAPVAYITGESVESVISAITAISGSFLDLPIDRLQPLLRRVADALGDQPAARAGLEMALYDLWAKRWNLPLWQFFGGAVTTLITDLTIPIVPPAEAGVLAEAAYGEGFRTLKIKVGDGSGHATDLERVEAILRAAPCVRLRIDANQAFSPEDAVAFAFELEKLKAPIDLLEQPVAHHDIAGLKYVRDRVTVPVFADEAACSPADVVRLLQADAVDGINVKLMKSGITGAIEIIDLCRAAEKKLMLGCMLETSLGIAAAAQLAAGMGAFDFLDLDSHRLLAPTADLRGGFVVSGDVLALGTSQEAGWGVTRQV